LSLPSKRAVFASVLHRLFESDPIAECITELPGLLKIEGAEWHGSHQRLDGHLRRGILVEALHWVRWRRCPARIVLIEGATRRRPQSSSGRSSASPGMAGPVKLSVASTLRSLARPRRQARVFWFSLSRPATPSLRYRCRQRSA
jgi:hypothetical protein